jgi:hypothetical protein
VFSQAGGLPIVIDDGFSADAYINEDSEEEIDISYSNQFPGLNS